MRLLSLISRNAFIKEDTQAQNPHAVAPTSDGQSPENRIQERVAPEWDKIWNEVAIKHNPLDSAIKHILGPIDEEQYHEIVAYMKYHLEQTNMAVLSRDVTQHTQGR